jgi:signal transduction histidine kinase
MLEIRLSIEYCSQCACRAIQYNCMGILKKALHELNFRARAKELGVSVWASPQFVFLLMGAIVVLVLLTTRFIAMQYLNPDLSFIITLAMSIFLLVVTYVVVNAFERVLEAQRREAIRTSEVLELKDQFVFIAAHELRNPVNAIKWAVELMESRLSRGTTVSDREMYDILNRSSNRLLNLVHDLLKVARIESDALQLSYGACSTKLACDSVVEKMSKGAVRGSKVISCVIPPDTPDILADQDSLKEILDNLISNALKYSADGTEVNVRAIWDESYVTISVEDSGRGISEQDATHIFKKFWRSGDAKKTDGTGLGLFITKHLVEEMGGGIWFESEVDKGTKFFVKLPIAQDEKQA